MLVDVTVKVPEEALGAFHVMFGEWLHGVRDGQKKTAERLEWGADDGQIAQEMWDDLPGANTKGFIDALIEGGEMDSASVASRLGLNPGQLPGVHGWIGRVSVKFGRKNPVKAGATAKGTVWWADPVAGELFKRVKR